MLVNVSQRFIKVTLSDVADVLHGHLRVQRDLRVVAELLKRAFETHRVVLMFLAVAVVDKPFDEGNFSNLGVCLSGVQCQRFRCSLTWIIVLILISCCNDTDAVIEWRSILLPIRTRKCLGSSWLQATSHALLDLLPADSQEGKRWVFFQLACNYCRVQLFFDSREDIVIFLSEALSDLILLLLNLELRNCGLNQLFFFILACFGFFSRIQVVLSKLVIKYWHLANEVEIASLRSRHL